MTPQHPTIWSSPDALAVNVTVPFWVASYCHVNVTLWPDDREAPLGPLQPGPQFMKTSPGTLNGPSVAVTLSTVPGPALVTWRRAWKSDGDEVPVGFGTSVRVVRSGVT